MTTILTQQHTETACKAPMEQETKLSFVVQKKKKTIYHKADGLALRSNSN